MHTIIWVLSLVSVLSCNVYDPLSKASSEEELLLEGQKCLHDRDYDCAIEQFQKLPDGEQKSLKLCTAYMTKAGLTLSALVDIVSNSGTGSKLLGQMAQRLTPWTSAKQSAAESAVTTCAGVTTTDSNRSAVILFRAVSLLTDCTLRIARVDQQVSVADGDSCTTAGNQDGTLSASEIATTADGGVSSGSPGMCSSDVTACLNDIVSLANLASSLTNSGLGNLRSNVDAIPTALKSNSTVTGTARNELKNTF